MKLADKIQIAYGNQTHFAKVAGVGRRAVVRWVTEGKISQQTTVGFKAQEMLHARLKDVATELRKWMRDGAL